MVEQISTPEGFEVVGFQDGPAALEAAKRLSPQLIIADYHLDNMTFSGFCKEVNKLDHLSETLLGRASHLAGDRTFDRATYESRPDAVGAIERFRDAAADWRRAILSVDESDYDRTGLSSYPYGSDAEETFPSMVWWQNHEVLHHGAEIALLRDLYVHRVH